MRQELLWLAILAGQFFHALLRTSAVKSIAQGSAYKTIVLNMAANLTRLLVLSGGIGSVMASDYVGVVACVVGQALGDYVALRGGEKKLDGG